MPAGYFRVRSTALRILTQCCPLTVAFNPRPVTFSWNCQTNIHFSARFTKLRPAASSKLASSNKPYCFCPPETSIHTSTNDWHLIFFHFEACPRHRSQRDARQTPFQRSIPSAAYRLGLWVPRLILRLVQLQQGLSPERYVQRTSCAERSNTPLRTSRTGEIKDLRPRF